MNRKNKAKRSKKSMPKRQSEAKRSEKKNENEANFFFSSFRETKRKGSKTVSVSHCFASKREKKLEAKMGYPIVSRPKNWCVSLYMYSTVSKLRLDTKG